MQKTYFYERNKTIANNFKNYSKIEPITDSKNASNITFNLKDFDIIESAFLVFKYNDKVKINIDDYIVSNYEYKSYIDLEKEM